MTNETNAPPPVGTVVEFDLGASEGPQIWQVVDDARWPLKHVTSPSRTCRPHDWSRVTVVPVPEGWEPVATKEEATRAGDGSLMCMYSLGAGSRWRFADHGFFPGGDLRYIWLRRKPAEPQFNMTDAQRMLMDAPVKPIPSPGRGHLVPAAKQPAQRQIVGTPGPGGNFVREWFAEFKAYEDKLLTVTPKFDRQLLQQPAPVDVPVVTDGRYKLPSGDVYEVRGGRGMWVRFFGDDRSWNDRIARRLSDSDRCAVANWTRLPDPAPEQFVPRVAKREDIRPGARVGYMEHKPGVLRGTVSPKGWDGQRAEVVDVEDHDDPRPNRKMWILGREVDNGHWTLIRPAPEAQAFDPRALRKGDVVGWSWGKSLTVGRIDGEIAWWEGGGTAHAGALRRNATHVNGTPIAEWVATVQPGRIAKIPHVDPGKGREFTLVVHDELTDVPPETIQRLITEAMDLGKRPTCAACSRPITGRPLELDEGAVTLCPGDACVNDYARMHAPKRYDPDAEREACRGRAEWLGRDTTDYQADTNGDLAAERKALNAAARDAHEANRYHRGALLDGVWTKGRL